MNEEGGQRETDAGRRRSGAILAGCALLAACAMYLVFANYRGQVALARFGRDTFLLDLQNRAVSTGYYFAERKYDLQSLANSREVSSYFVSESLGMSAAYGLRVSLFVIENALRDALRQKAIHGLPIYTRFLLLGEGLEPLVDTSPDAGFDLPRDLSSKAEGADPFLVVDERGQDVRLALCGPCLLKGKRVGTLVGWLDLATLDAQLVAAGRAGPERRVNLAAPSGRLICPPGEPACEFTAHFSPPLVQTVAEGGLTPFTFSDPDGGIHRVQAARASVANVPLNLVGMLPTGEIPGPLTSLLVLLGTASLSAATIAILVVLIRSNMKNLILQARFEETERQQSLLTTQNQRLEREVARRVQAERELLAQQEEQRALERKMLHAQKLESLGVLAGGIAHDFNNLLMGVLGNVDLALLKASPDASVRTYLQRIEAAARRAADLTNQMLAYSGRGRFVVEAVDLSRLVGEMGDLLRTVVAKTATLETRLETALPTVEADATQLRQVVMNLITNASDALGDRPGVISVSTGVVSADAAYLASTANLGVVLPEGLYACLEVVDTGCGIDPDTLRRIFDPFFTTKAAGRGLGLAATLGIVRGHRGTLRIDSEPGRGTTFRVLLPVSEASAQRPEPLSRPSSEAVPSLRSATVLVVDDDDTVRSVARDMLEGAGLTVLTACDGFEGVEVFQRHRDAIDVVLLDLTMPRMGGEEALGEIRRIDEGVPVILSSGYSQHDAAKRLRGAGNVGFVQKPYRLERLLEAIAERLGGSGGA